MKKFIYEKDNGTFGTFHFDRRDYDFIKTSVEGMPNIELSKSVCHVIITPMTFDAFCMLGDFVDRNGFDCAVKDNTTTTLWSKIIAFLTK